MLCNAFGKPSMSKTGIYEWYISVSKMAVKTLKMTIEKWIAQSYPQNRVPEVFWVPKKALA